MKTVHWQALFTSKAMGPLRIDIYDDDYTGTPVQLTLGDDPFETESDMTSDYFFESRPSTGALTIADTSGTLMSEIMPQTNISRPVRLIRVSDGTILWQGFLSCEKFNQDFTSGPHTFTVFTNSVLAAMRSAELKVDTGMLFNTILAHIAFCIKSLEDQVGLNLIRNVSLAAAIEPFRYLYINSFYQAEEIVSGELTSYEVHSVPLLSVLEYIAGFFGCVVIESGQDIIFRSLRYNSNHLVYDSAQLRQEMYDGCIEADHHIESPVDMPMRSLVWKGDKHQTTTYQGARRVIVNADVVNWIMRIIVPATPYSWLTPSVESRWALWGEVYANSNRSFHTQCTFQSLFCQMNTTNTQNLSLSLVSIYQPEVLNRTVWWTDNNWRTYYQDVVTMMHPHGTIAYYPTSFLTKFRAENGSLEDGLAICGLPAYIRIGDQQFRPLQKFALTADNFLFRYITPLPFCASEGYFNINFRIAMLTFDHGKAYPSASSLYQYGASPRIRVALKAGNLFWDGTAWTTTFSTFEILINEQGRPVTNYEPSMDTQTTDGLFIPITRKINGQVSFLIYHEIGIWTPGLPGEGYHACFDVILQSLEVTYEAKNDELRSGRQTNGYVKYIREGFANVVDRPVHIFSDAHNDPAANMLYNSDGSPVSYAEHEDRRPENKLLSLCNDYYSKARDIKTVITEYYPSLAYTDIVDPSGNRYLSLAQRHNWKDDTTTLSLFEAPE